MRIDAGTGFAGYDVYDEAMSMTIPDVLWVDDTALEVVVLEMPPRWVGHELVTTTIKVAYVRIDTTAMRITVNTCLPLTVHMPVVIEKEPQACRECCQEEACRRINYCAAHRGEFGGRAP